MKETILLYNLDSAAILFLQYAVQFPAFAQELPPGNQSLPGVSLYNVLFAFPAGAAVGRNHYAAGEPLVMDTCIRHPVTTGSNDYLAGADPVYVDALAQGSALYKQRPPSGPVSFTPWRPRLTVK